MLAALDAADLLTTGLFMTVRMQQIDTGKFADVHPGEVENWSRTGWRRVTQEDAPHGEVGAISGDDDLGSDEPRGQYLAVKKGPGGSWFVKDGRKIVSEGYATEAEAEKAMAEMVA